MKKKNKGLTVSVDSSVLAALKKKKSADETVSVVVRKLMRWYTLTPDADSVIRAAGGGANG